MKKIISILTIMLCILLFSNCEKNEEIPAITKINYVGFESGFTVNVSPNGNVSQEVRIATSNKTNTDRTFNITVNTDLTTADPSAFSVPSSVIVPADSNVGVFIIDVVGSNVDPAGADVLTLMFDSEDEDLLLSEPISLKLMQVCPNPELILKMTFDTYPEEAYWQVYDMNDVLLFQSGINDVDGCYAVTPNTRSFCLPAGDYQFLMGDCYGDGGTAYSLTYDGTILYSSAGISGQGEVIVITLD